MCCCRISWLGDFDIITNLGWQRQQLNVSCEWKRVTKVKWIIRIHHHQVKHFKQQLLNIEATKKIKDYVRRPFVAQPIEIVFCLKWFRYVNIIIILLFCSIFLPTDPEVNMNNSLAEFSIEIWIWMRKKPWNWFDFWFKIIKRIHSN